MSDNYTAEVARALAAIADAVAADLEVAGIDAEATKGVATVYKQLALELRGSHV